MPVHSLQVVALGQKNGPENVKDGLLLPAGKGTVDAAVVAELFRQVVPLAARPHPKDDAVEGLARIAALAACFGRRVIDSQHFVDQLPKRVGDIPDRRQGLLRCVRFSVRFHAAIIGGLQVKTQPAF